MVDEILDVIKVHLGDFNMNFFFVPGEQKTLMDGVRPGAIQAIAKDLIARTKRQTRGVFLMRLDGLRPSADFVSPRCLWIAPRPQPHALLALLPDLPVVERELALDRFPPLSGKSTWGASALGPHDSLLGTVALGHEGAVANLKRIVGALCVVMSQPETIVRTSPSPGTVVFALFEDGALELSPTTSPVMPPLPRQMVPGSELEELRGLLNLRATTERDRRFRVALEFLATGWVLTGSQAFMNYFIALDALFGKKNDRGNLIKKGVAARSRLSKAEQRVELLIAIRNDLMHGRCSEMSMSPNYLTYYERFGSDPARDLFQMVRECLKAEPSIADPAPCSDSSAS